MPGFFWIARATGYALAFDGNGNTILYKSDRLKVLSRGVFDVPRDDYAQRNIAWAHFQITQGPRSGTQFWYFNTHLPHRHNQAADPNTHAIIANMLLDKRIELGAGDSPIIVTGDCNPSSVCWNGSGRWIRVSRQDLCVRSVELVQWQRRGDRKF